MHELTVGKKSAIELTPVRLSRSAYQGRIWAVKGALASTLLNAKTTNGTPYSLVHLTLTASGNASA